ncbi:MAG: molybdenum cofactor biosynthesis protein MoaA [Phormidesmis priestleyi Ana]|uniref:GTP 3',8-cyclase n=1 Tax=Phormidesmis priestleyi Ana TaxID=1666911 RepID=A0A0P8BRY9_9CYAN|nr:MAG: molybdenum cofactor biosynthesis protein MoaA [Phormidesmis priestleyi Ana]
MTAPNAPSANRIDYLRISLIDRCNFQCVYCMPEGADLQYALREHWLTHDEILLLLREVFIPLGFTRFRLTGGEPLLRPGIVELVSAIARLPQTEDLALTTNGFRLKKLAQPLYDAGLSRINISLDSLNPDTFQKIIGKRGQSQWQDVWQGIQSAHRVGFSPLKLNVVVIPGINDHEVPDLAALTLDQEWHVRFIEFMPIGNSDLFDHKGWIDSETIRTQISEKWGLSKGQVKGNGPADVFRIPGAKGTLGFISQMSECFCDRCNRMRLSADGLLRPCLLNETGQIDLRTSLRSGTSLTTLRDQVGVLVNQKPEINFKMRESGATGAYSRTMSQIGG